MLPADVERDVAEAVDDQSDRPDAVVSNLRRWELDAHELVRIDGRAKLLERDAGGEVGRGRREEVAPVEGAGHRLQRVVGVGELVRLGDPAEALRGRQEEAVVGADVQPPVAVAQRQGAPAASHARIDDGQVDARGHVPERIRQHERSLQHVPRADPVGDVDDASLGGDRRDDPVTRADEIVLEPEVGQEGDDHEMERNASTSPSRS